MDDRLGITGKTVVYIFPDGEALKERDKQLATDRIDVMLANKATELEELPIDPEALIHSLLETGQITEAQVQVGRFDQQTTGMSIMDALIARGWVSTDLLESLLESFSGLPG